ncbi:hypothetical protein E4U59_002499 [Claviceps monticola]|nr:hypothetical protein E4U59_002499 [Claviceps monticola]
MSEVGLAAKAPNLFVTAEGVVTVVFFANVGREVFVNEVGAVLFSAKGNATCGRGRN